MQDRLQSATGPTGNPAIGLRFKTVGFDLDGTLIDTARDIAEALNHALRVGGCPPLAYERVRALIGGGAKRLLIRALAEHGGDAPPHRGREACREDVAALYDELLGHYRANIAVHSRPFPGVVDALDRLADSAVRLGVATNKLEALARDLLGALGLADRFDCILGGDTLGAGRAKPGPDMLLALAERCGGGPAAFVGDSIYDTRAAVAAGQKCIAVSFGYSDRPASALAADRVIDHFDALIPALGTL